MVENIQGQAAAIATTVPYWS